MKKIAPRRNARSRPPVFQYTLTSLVTELRERTETCETQTSQVEWLYSFTRGLSIRMRHDEHHAQLGIEPPSEHRHDHPSRDAEDGFQMAGKKQARGKRWASRHKTQEVPIVIERRRMCVKLEGHQTECDSFVGRIILSCDRRNLCIRPPLSAECNGAVIDARMDLPRSTSASLRPTPAGKGNRSRP